MSMRELHLKVLEMMERIRAKHKAIFYGTRKANAHNGSDRIGQGFVFLGDDNYIFVPICPISGFPNPTTTVGLVFGLNDGDIIECWVEIIIPVVGGRNHHACHEDNAVYEKLAEFLMNMGLELEVNDTRHYARKKFYVVKDGEQHDDAVAVFEEFLDKEIDEIVKILRTCEVGETLPLVYNQSTMCESIDRFLRHEIQDAEVCGRLERLCTSVRGMCR